MRFIKIFDWEHAVIDYVRSWPRSGPLYDAMDLISDFAKTKWVILFVLVVIGFRYGWRKLSSPLFVSLAAVGLADLISHRSVQDFFKRPRPNFLYPNCNATECWGFISSHSTSVFAVVAVLYCFNKNTLRWSLPIALAVCISRIYLTSHFPLDVIFGAMTGGMIGFFVVYLYEEVVLRKFKIPHMIFWVKDLDRHS